MLQTKNCQQFDSKPLLLPAKLVGRSLSRARIERFRHLSFQQIHYFRTLCLISSTRRPSLRYSLTHTVPLLKTIHCTHTHT